MPLTEKGIFLEFPIVVLFPHLILLISPVIFSISPVPRNGSKQAAHYLHSSWPNLTPCGTRNITATCTQNTATGEQVGATCHHSWPLCPWQRRLSHQHSGCTESECSYTVLPTPCSRGRHRQSLEQADGLLGYYMAVRHATGKEEWFKLKRNLTQNWERSRKIIKGLRCNHRLGPQGSTEDSEPQRTKS